MDKAALTIVDVHRVLPDEDLGFWMLNGVPKMFEGVVQSLYSTPQADFTSKLVREALIAEALRLEHSNPEKRMSSPQFQVQSTS